MNNVLIDWCAFTVRNIEYSDVYALLGLDGSNFIETNYGFYGYKKRTNFDGINVMWEGQNENSGVLVEMSGQGCRAFETYGLGDFMSLFKLLQADDFQTNFTRIDIAYDDFDDTLPLDKLLTDYLHDNFVSRCQNSELVLSKGNKHGITIQHGSKSSNVLIRIYDKKAERKRTDLDHWVRCELQLRKENAQGVINLLLIPGSDIREIYFSVLNNYLRYILPSDAATDWHLPMTDYWAKFVETWKVNSVYVNPGTEYNIHNLSHTVINMYGNSTLTYIECVGMDRFVEDLKRNASKRPRAAKYEKIKRDYEKEFGKLEGLPPAADEQSDDKKSPENSDPPMLTGG